VAICGSGGRFERAACPRGTVCVGQPNGTGVCMVRPDGYIAPPRFNTMRMDPSRSLPEQESEQTPTIRKPPLKLFEKLMH
jgi:hypothetical protein